MLIVYLLFFQITTEICININNGINMKTHKN